MSFQKQCLLLIISLFSILISSEKVLAYKHNNTAIKTQCYCDKDSTLSNLIDCSPQYLSNKAKVYWSFTCDSSWITLENVKGEKSVLFSLDTSMLWLSTRIGHVYFYEYKNNLLFINKVISGCCDPVDYYLYDKNNGTFIAYLGRALFVSEDPKLPYFVSFTNSGYQEEDTVPGISSITVLNLNTLKSSLIDLPTSVIDGTSSFGIYNFPEDLVKSVTLNQSTLSIKITYAKNNEDELEDYVLNLDLKKY